MKSTLNVLKSIPGLSVEEIPSECCGMVGSFGYEAEHESICMKIGELILFPFIRSLPKNTSIIANGTSCRQQIQKGTRLKALHLAEFLVM